MREIKFRAWDIQRKQMYYYTLLEARNNEILDCCISYDYEMQYTGLKDKNGVEIYEGDVVKDKFDNIGIARYENGALIISNTCGWFKDNHGTSFEVIGNIYENPELLKDA